MADFSAVEARTARAVIRALSNRQARIGTLPLPVIYDDGHVMQSVGGMLVESTGPRFTAVTMDIPTPITGQTVFIDEMPYRIREHQPNGTGTSLCMLHKA